MLKPLALYIHWPFCRSKCPYCDFNSHVRTMLNEEDWHQAYLSELHRMAQLTGPRHLRSIFFGGGTPSLMTAKLVELLINRASKLWHADEGLEISLEANPNSAEVNHFADLKSAGVNRLSLGIQALNDKDLKFLGRSHTAQEGIQAIQSACHIFSRVSFDLIYARPAQTLEEWYQELNQALSLGCKHLSLYQLTIEPNTSFFSLHQRGELKLPEDTVATKLFEATQAIMNQRGLPAYEISNHAIKGQECQHNLAYWRYQDYIGIGPGAHGRLSLMTGEKISTEQHRVPEVWRQRVLEQGTGDKEQITLSSRDQCIEAIMMGLRLTDGIPLASLPLAWEEVIKSQGLMQLLEEKFLEKDEFILKATPQGQQCLNQVLVHLLVD